MINALSIISFTATANAEQTGEHGAQIPWETLGFHAVNLLLLVSAILFFGGKMMRNAVKNRAARIANHLETSNKMRKEAQDRYKGLEARLLHMEKEVATMKELAGEEAKREAALIETQTVADIERIQAASVNAVKNELAAARADLHADAVRLATDIAAEQLKANITGAANEDLTREFISSATKEATTNG